MTLIVETRALVGPQSTPEYAASADHAQAALVHGHGLDKALHQTCGVAGRHSVGDELGVKAPFMCWVVSQASAVTEIEATQVQESAQALDSVTNSARLVSGVQMDESGLQNLEDCVV